MKRSNMHPDAVLEAKYNDLNDKYEELLRHAVSMQRMLLKLTNDMKVLEETNRKLIDNLNTKIVEKEGNVKKIVYNIEREIYAKISEKSKELSEIRLKHQSLELRFIVSQMNKPVAKSVESDSCEVRQKSDQKKEIET